MSQSPGFRFQAVPIVEYRLSPRVVLRPGSFFRVSGGPRFRGDDGKQHTYRSNGVWEFEKPLFAFGREFVLGHQVVGSLKGQVRLFFVRGPAYTGETGLRFAPVRIRRCRLTRSRSLRRRRRVCETVACETVACEDFGSGLNEGERIER